MASNDKFRCYQCDMKLGNRWDLQNHLNWNHSTGLRYRVNDEGLLLNTGDEINEEATMVSNGQGTRAVCSNCGTGFSDIKLFFHHFMRGLPQCYKMAIGKKRSTRVDIGTATGELFDHWAELSFENGIADIDSLRHATKNCKCHKCSKLPGNVGKPCQRKKAKLAFNTACKEVNSSFQCYQCDTTLGNREDLQNHLNGMHTTGMRHRVGDDGRVLNEPHEILENETKIANGEAKMSVCSRCGEGSTKAFVFMDHLIENPPCYKMAMGRGGRELRGRRRTKAELVQLVEHIAKKTIPVYQKLLDEEESRKDINVWIKLRTMEGEEPNCPCGEKFEQGEMVYKHILEECDMDVMTSVSLEDEGHKTKKEKKRETKSEKRKRKNEKKKHISKSDSHEGAPQESTQEEESRNGIVDTGRKPFEDCDGQDHDIPDKDESSQESLKPSIDTPSDRSEKTIRAVEAIFERARIRKGQTSN